MESCLKEATKNRKNSKNRKRKLCPRGYCTAKLKFDVYPSAYANAYASKVCKGTAPDYYGIKKGDPVYTAEASSGLPSLKRWFEEEWVNVCEKVSESPLTYAPCGRPSGSKKPYPYCRPLYSKTLVNATDLNSAQIEHMCRTKRSLEKETRNAQVRSRKPKRIFLSEQFGGSSIEIPVDVREAAKEGLKLIKAGFSGGTPTGWNRAKQLSGTTIDIESLADMRTWFARHGPDAINGGTSYVGYRRWVDMGKPRDVNKNSLRGAVAWLIWGGDAAYRWLKSSQIQTALSQAFPDRKKADSVIRLY